MKTRIFVLLMSTIFSVQLFSQTLTTIADQPIDYALIEETQNLKFAFSGKYGAPEFNFEGLSRKKLKPAGKGALIGFGVGTTAGIIAGLVKMETWSINHASEDSPGAKLYFVSIVGGIGSAAGTGIGALIGVLAKDKSVNRNTYVPRPGEVPLVILNKKF